MLLKSPPPGETSPQATEGVHFPMWRPCRGSLSRAKLVPGLHIKGLSNKSPDRCRRRGFTVLPPTGGIINSLPLKGKRLTTFCASLTLLQIMFAVHPRESVSHDSQVALLPYESCSLATPSGRQNKSLYAFLQRHGSMTKHP